MVRYDDGGGAYTPPAPRPFNPVEEAAKKFISEVNSPAVQEIQQTYSIIQQGPPPGSVDKLIPYNADTKNDVGITKEEKAFIVSAGRVRLGAWLPGGRLGKRCNK